MAKILFKMTAITDVGLVRSNNEDNFIVNSDLTKTDWYVPVESAVPLILGRSGCILVVADGMGGANAGEVASDIAVNSVRRQFDGADLLAIRQNGDSAIEKFVKKVIINADSEIKKHAKNEKACRGMGTTIVVVWIVDGVAYLGWCGDSRAYMFNSVSGLVRVSKDHSFVQELVDKGALDPDLAFDHPQSNIITRCLSDGNGKAVPDYKRFFLSPGDFILLCSDGLCGYCRDEEIQEVMLETGADIYLCRNTLIQHALDAGGYDNVTIALFQYVASESEDGEDSSRLSDTFRTDIPKVVESKSCIAEQPQIEDSQIKSSDEQEKEQPVAQPEESLEPVDHVDEADEVADDVVPDEESVETKEVADPKSSNRFLRVFYVIVFLVLLAMVCCAIWHYKPEWIEAVISYLQSLLPQK